jgi:hypothetical protein
MIVCVIATAIVWLNRPQKDTFIEKFLFKGTKDGVEINICAKQKNDSPTKKSRSDQK